MRSPAQYFLLLLLAVVGVKLSEQVYRYVVFRDERAHAGVLQERLLDAGAELELARAAHRGVHDTVTAEVRHLEGEREQLMRLQRQLAAGRPHRRYRSALEEYNRQVVRHHERYEKLQRTRDRYLAAMDRYAALADSVRAVAAQIGEPYYNVPTSLEAAVARGVLTPDR